MKQSPVVRHATPRMNGQLIRLDGTMASTALVGGKGASLSRLASLGVSVPPAIALTTAAYAEALNAVGVESANGKAAVDGVAIRRAFESGPLTDQLVKSISAAYDDLSDRVVGDLELAVRSSATAEDSAEHSFAGLHDTILGVRDVTQLESAVRRCWASLWTDRAVAYRHERGVTDASIAVVVQQMMRTDVSIVAFTADPVSGRRDRTVINATWGLGEALVSGIVTPDHVVADRSGSVVDYQTGEKTTMVIAGYEGTRVVGVPRALQRVPVLTTEQVSTIVAVANRVSDAFGYPVDVEGGFAAGNLHLFQARPITTLRPVEGPTGPGGTA